MQELPSDLSESLALLETLDDDALWQLAQSCLSIEDSSELENLHLKRQSEGLTAEENARTTFLVGQYERTIVLRAQAARVLKERSLDISSLLVEPLS